MITEFGALSTDRIRNTLSAFGSHALPNIRAADVAVQKLSLFLQAISKSNSISFPEFVIYMIIHLPSLGEFHRILVG